MKTIITLCTILSLFAVSPSAATLIRVPDDHSSIQEGILASQDGDTVLVSDGTYEENINFRGRNITVASHFILDRDPNHISATIIDGSSPVDPDTASCVLIVSGETENAVLEGFTLTGGFGTIWTDTHLNADYREGGGILIELSDPVIRHNIIRDNEAIDNTGVVSAGGGGIRCGDGDPLIDANIIIDNKGLYGGGIVMNFSTGTIRNNIIANNSGGVDYGGSGIWTYAAGTTVIENNTIVGNVSDQHGGGILVWSTSVTAKNNILWENEAAMEGDQIHTLGGATVTLVYSNIQDDYQGEGNLDIDPLFDLTNLYLSENSPCIDSGDPDGPSDPEDPTSPGSALYPALGTLRNDMGAYGGTTWPLMNEFTSGLISIETGELFFEYCEPGNSDTVFMGITNNGCGGLTINDIPDVSTSDYDIIIPVDFPVEISPFSWSDIPVVWSPNSNGALFDTLFVDHTCPEMANPLPVPVRLYQFSSIRDGDMVTDIARSGGISWVDYDTDGYMDLLVTNGLDSDENNAIYRGTANGLTPVPGGLLTGDSFSSRASSWGDFDNDGDADVVVTNGSDQNNQFYINIGDGSFSHAEDDQISINAGDSQAATWGDFDNNGLLDIFITNSGVDDAEVNILYQQISDHAFIPVQNEPFSADLDRSKGALWADYDNDGDLDLFVSNDANENNALYRNEGDGSFTRIEDGDIVSNRGKSCGGSWGDYNNDGYMDLFVSNWSDQNNFLYLNEGDGGFERIRNGPVVNDNGWSVGSAWGDYDNDGDLDLFVANGGDDATPDFLYENDGTGQFTRIADASFSEDGSWSYGAAWIDYDNDGDLDLSVAKWSDSGAPNALYLNTGTLNHWLKIRCMGTYSNRSGIGTRIEAVAEIDGEIVRQSRDITGQSGFCGQDGLMAHFGLGNAQIVDSLMVRWPSGIVQVLTDIQADQDLVIEEEGVHGILPDPPRPYADLTLRISPNPFSRSTMIRYFTPADEQAVISIYDMNGRLIQRMAGGRESDEGWHEIPWNGMAGEGTRAPTGTYICRIKTGSSDATKVLIKKR